MRGFIQENEPQVIQRIKNALQGILEKQLVYLGIIEKGGKYEKANGNFDGTNTMGNNETICN